MEKIKVIWSEKANQDYENALDFWDNYTGSPIYSDKIESETKKIIQEISNPECIYLGRYYKKLNLYVRNILNGRFQIYFSVNEEKQLIEIIHFKGEKQNPIQ